MNRLLVPGLVALVVSALPTASFAQIVRSSPATASPGQFDPFGNPASNPYLNPMMAATTQPSDPSTTLLYMLGARRYVQGQQEAILEQRKQANRSDEALRKARGRAAPGRLDPAQSRYRYGSTEVRAGARSDSAVQDRFGRVGSYYGR